MPSMSIVCAIEAGHLATQTLLMASTLRRFGGSLGSAPIVAVQGRHGPEISRDILKQLEELQVGFVFRPDLNPAPWFNYSNKIAAVTFAEQAFDTDFCIWADSDILFVGEPEFCRQPPAADFIGRFEYLPPAAIEGHSKYLAYWTRICEICGTDFDALALHDLDHPHLRMRPFFNSGFFAWRKSSGFAESYARCFSTILKSRLAPKDIGPWFADQVSITPALLAADLGWQMMNARDHLMMFQHQLGNREFEGLFPAAHVVHYSKSRNPDYVGRFDTLLQNHFPDVLPLVERADGLPVPGRPGPVSAVRKLYRHFRQKAFAKSCKAV